jgi:hypothetical protein
MKSGLRLLLVAASVSAQAQTIDLKGAVYSVSGAPIAGATCRFKTAGNQAVTDADGKFDFGKSTAVRAAAGYSVAITAEGGQLSLSLDRGQSIEVDLFAIDGRRLANLVAAVLPAGTHRFGLGAAGSGNRLYLLRVKRGSEIAWHKLTRQGGFASIAQGAARGPLAKTSAIVDSLFCTAPEYHGGLTHTNGRNIGSYSGTQNIRMFSSDPAWKVCSPPITFNFDNSPGVARYKQLIPDWVATEQEILMEVCQSTFKLASQAKKWTTYIANIKTDDGVAATGGNELTFNTGYIADQPDNYAGWIEVTGVQIHEAVHSYQPYYETPGAGGFGEAMPDAVRALTGYFKWPTGTKCTGSYADAYQDGGKYWYFIEMKHPGFLTTVWQQKSGDITTRVQSITGESLSAMATECKTKGMP